MGFSRQECRSGLPYPSPGDLPNPRIEPESLTSPALASGLFTTSGTWEALQNSKTYYHVFPPRRNQDPVFVCVLSLHSCLPAFPLSQHPFVPWRSLITDHVQWPHKAWLSFTELDKAVVRVIRLAGFLSLWFQSVYPLIPSPNTYCLNWVSLTLDVVCLFMDCSSKAQLLLLSFR